MEIFDGDCGTTEKAAVTKYCGGTKPDPYLSTASQLCIKFISDSAESARGFSANYVACTGKCDGTEGPLPLVITAPKPGPELTAVQPSLGAQPSTESQPNPGLNNVKPLTKSGIFASASRQGIMSDDDLEALVGDKSFSQQETSERSPHQDSGTVFTGDIRRLDTSPDSTQPGRTGMQSRLNFVRQRPKMAESSLRHSTVKSESDYDKGTDNDDDVGKMEEESEQGHLQAR